MNRKELQSTASARRSRQPHHRVRETHCQSQQQPPHHARRLDPAQLPVLQRSLGHPERLRKFGLGQPRPRTRGHQFPAGARQPFVLLNRTLRPHDAAPHLPIRPRTRLPTSGCSLRKDDEDESLGSAETFAPAVAVDRQPFDHWAFTQSSACNNSGPNRRKSLSDPGQKGLQHLNQLILLRLDQ